MVVDSLRVRRRLRRAAQPAPYTGAAMLLFHVVVSLSFVLLSLLCVDHDHDQNKHLFCKQSETVTG